MKITITEALSELNLIKKKLEKKRANLMGLLVTAKHLKDPMESEGGSQAFFKKEEQSIRDLSGRFILLKSAIAKANVENSITVNDVTRTIYSWLVWKRDLSSNEIAFSGNVYNSVKSHFDRISNRPEVYKDTENNTTHLVEYTSNVNQAEYLKNSELLTETFEKLDGQLSLKNATIVLEV